jgi:diguanylate cyclase (GGDEF)-like protein
VRDLYEDRQGTLWAATDNGLNEWRPDPGAFVRYGHDPEQPGSLSDDRLTTLFQDSGGVLWIGTLNGANRWNYLSDAFAYLQVQPGEHSTISGNVITAMAESSEGAVWIATYGGGLNRVDPATASIRHFQNIPGDEQSLSDDRVMALYVGKQDEVWIGTRKGGLNLLEPRSGKVTRFRHEPGLANGLSSDSVTAVLGDRAGNIWVGTYGGGLNRLDPASGEFTSYRHDSRDPRSLSSDRVLDLFSDSDGTLWVGTEDGGLNRFDPKTESFTAYRHDPNDPLSLGSDAAWNVMESRDGSLWISTLGGGLNRWTAAARNADVPEFDQYRKGGGLKSDTVFGVLEDQDGFLWLSTNRGLTRLNPENGLARHFDRFNGLRGDEFNFGAYLKTRSGQLWFGGSEGLVTFNPEMLLVNTNQPDIVLSAHTRLEHLATAYSNEQQVPEPIILGYDDDHISFSFAALDYASPDKNQYRYRLHGFDDEWVDPGQLRTATYTSLPAGDYEFRVKASNNDGIWNEQGASLRLHVEPPPWQTPLAYSFYTLLLGGTVINYRRTQNKKLDRAAKHSAKLEREVQARTRELASRNDELKALNEKLLQASVTDSLTGLKNRRYLYESIGSEVALIERRIEDRRTPGTESKTVELTPSLFFMMIDLDGFKTINDSYGHLAGDQALLQVRDVLQSTCRKSDIIIRWGGDEFMVVGRNTSARAAEQLAERIRFDLAERRYDLGEGHIGRLSGSIGFAMYPFSPLRANPLSWEQVVAVADHAAYTAKKNGRNAWVGVYGTRRTKWEEFAKTHINLHTLATQGMIELRSSLPNVREFGRQPVHEEVES